MISERNSKRPGKAILFSVLRDAFSNRSHSRDFTYARSEYLCNRVKWLAWVFLILLPAWTVFDWMLLPEESLVVTPFARACMLAALLLVLWLTRRGRLHLQRTRLAAGVLLASPALFYAVVLASLPVSGLALPGYSFIPYMLMAMLAIFPFSLLESATLGLILIGLEVYAQHVAGDLFTAQGIQAIWLLAALLSISMTANYFQLKLLLRLYREATHDPLTGLLNRGAMRRVLAQQLRAFAAHSQVTILMMDLDYFKRINDHFGHMVGDDVLRNFTQVLRRVLDPHHIIARYGGEEFMAILMGVSTGHALDVAEQIRQMTEAQSVPGLNGETVSYTVSMGVTRLKPDEAFELAAQRADNGLYEAKRLSRNRVVLV